MFQVIYESSKSRLKFVQSAFIHIVLRKWKPIKCFYAGVLQKDFDRCKNMLHHHICLSMNGLFCMEVLTRVCKSVVWKSFIRDFTDLTACFHLRITYMNHGAGSFESCIHKGKSSPYYLHLYHHDICFYFTTVVFTSTLPQWYLHLLYHHGIYFYCTNMVFTSTLLSWYLHLL